jgi:hypothetical protein
MQASAALALGVWSCYKQLPVEAGARLRIVHISVRGPTTGTAAAPHWHAALTEASYAASRQKTVPCAIWADVYDKRAKSGTAKLKEHWTNCGRRPA